ncbi:unnamed protein product [Amoebophrya sp. A120]|nr:unnamed protein product [Amoebophrya sp. A120]|eukprot:GSA120T00017800001.1
MACCMGGKSSAAKPAAAGNKKSSEVDKSLAMFRASLKQAAADNVFESSVEGSYAAAGKKGPAGEGEARESAAEAMQDRTFYREPPKPQNFLPSASATNTKPASPKNAAADAAPAAADEAPKPETAEAPAKKDEEAPSKTSSKSNPGSPSWKLVNTSITEKKEYFGANLGMEATAETIPQSQMPAADGSAEVPQSGTADVEDVKVEVETPEPAAVPAPVELTAEQIAKNAAIEEKQATSKKRALEELKSTTSEFVDQDVVAYPAPAAGEESSAQPASKAPEPSAKKQKIKTAVSALDEQVASKVKKAMSAEENNVPLSAAQMQEMLAEEPISALDSPEMIKNKKKNRRIPHPHHQRPHFRAYTTGKKA